MNIQRWIALGMLALLIACVATSSLWTAPFRDEVDEEPTATLQPDGSDLPPESAALSETPAAGTATPTLNPIIEEMMATAGAESVAMSNQPFVILAGDFTTIDATHQGTGTASIYQVGETQRVLRLDPFAVTSGPDLRVLLSTHPAPRTSTEALVGSIDLGPLRSATAAQNFEIPAGTSMDQYRSVVIYSLSFNIVYSTATLEPVRGQ